MKIFERVSSRIVRTIVSGSYLSLFLRRGVAGNRCALSAQRRRWIALRNLQRNLAHFFVDGSVGGQNIRPAEPVRLAGKIADLPACFLHQQHARGGVPFLQTELPEAVKAPGSYTRKVEGSRAVAAHAVRTQREVPVVVNVGISQAFVYREAGAKQARRKRGHVRHLYLPVIQRRAFTARGGEQLIVKRVEDHACDYRVPLRQTYRDAKTRIAVRKVRRAVQRIDMPAEFRMGSALV